jgi:hypothetical protein
MHCGSLSPAPGAPIENSIIATWSRTDLFSIDKDTLAKQGEEHRTAGSRARLRQHTNAHIFSTRHRWSWTRRLVGLGAKKDVKGPVTFTVADRTQEATGSDPWGTNTWLEASEPPLRSREWSFSLSGPCRRTIGSCSCRAFLPQTGFGRRWRFHSGRGPHIRAFRFGFPTRILNASRSDPLCPRHDGVPPLFGQRTKASTALARRSARTGGNGWAAWSALTAVPTETSGRGIR